PGGVPGRAAAHAGVSERGGAQGRPHSGGEERAVGPCGGPGDAHVPVGLGAAGDLRGGARAQAGGGRGGLLPHRRALLAHLVRAYVPVGLRESAQLRRLLDRVGQLGPAADREVTPHPGRPALPREPRSNAGRHSANSRSVASGGRRTSPRLLANPTATVSADASSHAAASEPHGTRYGISNTNRASAQPAAAASALPDSAATVPIARYSTARMRRISRARAPSVRSSALSCRRW